MRDDSSRSPRSRRTVATSSSNSRHDLLDSEKQGRLLKRHRSTRAQRSVELALNAEETQTLPTASQVVREETRDGPTLKSEKKSWGGHPSRDGTADHLLRESGSVGHRHRATTGTTSPKREAWAACRNWNHWTYFLWDPRAAPTHQRTRKGRHVISVRHHLTKYRPGLCAC